MGDPIVGLQFFRSTKIFYRVSISIPNMHGHLIYDFKAHSPLWEIIPKTNNKSLLTMYFGEALLYENHSFIEFKNFWHWDLN